MLALGSLRLWTVGNKPSTFQLGVKHPNQFTILHILCGILLQTTTTDLYYIWWFSWSHPQVRLDAGKTQQKSLTLILPKHNTKGDG